MKAVGYRVPGPIAAEQSLVDISLPEPSPSGRDLLVELKAISVNPVDYKVRRSTAPQGSEWKVLGWDAAGIVRAVGPEVTLFQPATRYSMPARSPGWVRMPSCIWSMNGSSVGSLPRWIGPKPRRCRSRR